jgi:hypothetical protein
MNSNPDEIYRAKAAADPVAPVTLWLYPDLRRVERPAQRPALENAKRRAFKYWLSLALLYTILVIALMQFLVWAEDLTDLRAPLSHAFSLTMLAWLTCLSIRIRMELRAALCVAMSASIPKPT